MTERDTYREEGLLRKGEGFGDREGEGHFSARLLIEHDVGLKEFRGVLEHIGPALFGHVDLGDMSR